MNVFCRNISIPGIILIGACIFYQPIIDLANLSQRDLLYSHIPLIPVVSLYLIWINRRTIFSDVRASPIPGIGLLTIVAIFVFFQRYYISLSNPIDTLSLSIFCMLLWLIGGFLLICGWHCFRRATFPMLFLAFMLPIPSVVLDPVVRFLQMGSVEATEGLLLLLNVPAYREGVLISLPGVTVEVAKECSGIRSAVALLVLCTAASYVFLKSNIRRWILILMMVPVTILKNGMRITTLALLGSYVDMAYITNSSLHSFGGKPFFVVAVLMMSPILWGLRRSEIKAEKAGKLKGSLLKSAEVTKEKPIAP